MLATWYSFARWSLWSFWCIVAKYQVNIAWEIVQETMCVYSFCGRWLFCLWLWENLSLFWRLNPQLYKYCTSQPGKPAPSKQTDEFSIIKVTSPYTSDIVLAWFIMRQKLYILMEVRFFWWRQQNLCMQYTTLGAYAYVPTFLWIGYRNLKIHHSLSANKALHW